MRASDLGEPPQPWPTIHTMCGCVTEGISTVFTSCSLVNSAKFSEREPLVSNARIICKGDG